MRLVEKRTTQPGAYVMLDANTDFPVVDAENSGTVHYFVNYWEKLGCLELPMGNRGQMLITVEGWDRLSSGRTGGIPSHVFIGMSFDPKLDAMYEDGIKAAVEQDCRMTAMRTDKVAPSDKQDYGQKICDRILAEIRRCQMAVVDFTEHNRGAYFEAGFALGLGRAVIWTCREDQIKEAHFDTRQYPHIVWKDAADLRRQLADRIHAMMKV